MKSIWQWEIQSRIHASEVIVSHVEAKYFSLPAIMILSSRHLLTLSGASLFSDGWFMKMASALRLPCRGPRKLDVLVSDACRLLCPCGNMVASAVGHNTDSPPKGNVRHG